MTKGGSRRLEIACIDAAHPQERDDFLAWLERNAAHVLGISDNEGCGCCADIYHLEIAGAAEPMPCAAGGKPNPHGLRYGIEKDRAIDAILGLH